MLTTQQRLDLYRMRELIALIFHLAKINIQNYGEKID